MTKAWQRRNPQDTLASVKKSDGSSSETDEQALVGLIQAHFPD